MEKIKLPPEGIFVGTGVYPTDTDTLLCTMLGHYSWQCQHFGPMEMLEQIIEDNQGNLAQVWGAARGFSPRLISEWFYALDEIGVNVLPPDWETCERLTAAECAELFRQHKDRFGAGLYHFVREAKKRGIYTAFIYTDAQPEWVRKIAGEGGEHFLGYDFGERYTFGLNDTPSVLAEIGKPSLRALADRLIRSVREHADARKREGWGLVMATSSNFHLDYEVLGGADAPVIEDFAFPSLNFASGFSRGLYRQHNLPIWGSHLAHEHYSWLPNSDPRRYAQLRAALYLKYMAGSKMIINESGNWFVEHTLAPDSPKLNLPQTARERFGILGWGEARALLESNPEAIRPCLEEARPYFETLDYHSPICREYRRVISDFWDFVKANGTPEGQPETTIALAKGDLDLTTARYNHNYAIGGLYDVALENPSWFQCAPERGWALARSVFFPEVPVTEPYKNIHLSGTPYGQVDVVSFAMNQIDADFLCRNYKALLFAGWNTCSERQYAILCEYVRRGGTLLISLPQLCTGDTRRFNFGANELVNGGDFSELCGVKVQGRGECFYWATVQPGSDALGCAFPRRFGILGVPMGRVEIANPSVTPLIVDDEQGRPIVTLHRYGAGKCYFINTWAYPGALDMDEGPGGIENSAGLPGYLYRAIARECRGHVWIAGDSGVPDRECDYIAYSHFPQAGKICLLNVDFAQERAFWLHQPEGKEKIVLAPSEFRVIGTAQ